MSVPIEVSACSVMPGSRWSENACPKLLQDSGSIQCSTPVVQSALEGWVRGAEACKAQQEGQKREREEALYAALEDLRAQLAAHEARAAAVRRHSLDNPARAASSGL